MPIAAITMTGGLDPGSVQNADRRHEPDQL
jgi:hypothetical protein